MLRKQMIFAANQSLFNKRISVPEATKVIFVADMFVEDYPQGGAELTSEALIKSCPLEIFKVHSKDVNLEFLQEHWKKYWIFGNFANLDPNVIPSIIANLQYSVLEYDYKYCKYRSPEKHSEIEKTACNCANETSGKVVSAFFAGAKSLWWMSEKQQDRYLTLFPELEQSENVVLSSVFDDTFFVALKLLREKYKDAVKTKWIVLGSPSWVKGRDNAVKWCQDNSVEYEEIWGASYAETLEKLAQAKGFVYLPEGGDTCPRMVIEAKLLGLELKLNDNVQHKNEEWFSSTDMFDTEAYLFAARSRFWNGIKSNMDYKPTISGYTTTRNCIKQNYPFEQCIRSMLEFCDEVCVVDSDSTDGTWERLIDLAYPDAHILGTTGQLELVEDIRAFGGSPHTKTLKTSKIKLKSVPHDWNHPRFAVFDGEMKAEARKMCSGDFCWQMDSDEIIHEDDVDKIKLLTKNFPTGIDILCLPVIEFWGGSDKVRPDVMPWKWRLSKNLPNITHGIPIDLRRVDANGNQCAAPGTDGCDMIDSKTGERIASATFYTPDVDAARNAGVNGHTQALQAYEGWFNQVVDSLPSVFHYSWHNLSRKIRLYRDYWTRHWNSLYDMNVEDTAETNMMFDKPWSEVNDAEIEELASRLKNIGGHIWHQKWNGQQTPWIKVNRTEPSVMSKECTK